MEDRGATGFSLDRQNDTAKDYVPPDTKRLELHSRLLRHPDVCGHHLRVSKQRGY